MAAMLIVSISAGKNRAMWPGSSARFSQASRHDAGGEVEHPVDAVPEAAGVARVDDVEPE
jgi:hypothetical protein